MLCCVLSLPPGGWLQTESDGRVFPVSNSSLTVINCLLEEAKRLGGELLLCTITCSPPTCRGPHMRARTDYTVGPVLCGSVQGLY